MKVFIKTLGCEKNTIDSEFAAGLLVNEGNTLTDDPQDADVIIVNTCGFIEDAKRQSVETILELADAKTEGQRLVITGCLSQRYAGDLSKDIPEADLILGVNDYKKLPQLLAGKDAERVTVSAEDPVYEELGSRVRGEAPWTASIKIAEGCNNACTYCAIPMMRGRYRSRKPEDILREAETLAAGGCKELVVIAQDVTYYGKDFGRNDMLPELIRDLCRIDGIEWVRLMYCYEDEITQGLIDVIRDEPKVCKYIDIPLQHASDRILKAMKRKSTRKAIEATV
ncbi:MAG: MiaB/RimO family radical SAM methylthiotransferase, partial [Firmicutes bacterium]|nr:MiaB/RimO family radical SAM methylthiotransferase [Bacillota bacterium]